MIQTMIVAGAAGVMRGAKQRTALAMLMVDVCAQMLPPLSLPDHTWVIGAYMTLDLVSALIVLKHPIGQMQKAVGMLFAILVMFDVGFMWSIVVDSRPPNVWLYWRTQVFVGWAQVGLLMSWGVYDAFRVVLDTYWLGRDVLHHVAGAQ